MSSGISSNHILPLYVKMITLGSFINFFINPIFQLKNDFSKTNFI